MDNMNELYEICETLEKSLKEANEKIRNAGGKLSPSDMDFVDKLTHSIKSIKTTIAMEEATENGGSYGDGSYRMGMGYSRDGGSYRNGGSYGDGSYDSGSYARGRGRNAMRDSMGRYSNRGYSRDDGYSRDGYSREGGYSGHGDMVDELKELMADAPDERTRREMAKLIQKMEQQ